jgi:hypothetical protein
LNTFSRRPVRGVLAAICLILPLLHAVPAAAVTIVNGHLAFGAPTGVGVVNPDGVGPHPVTAGAGDANPSWSPDGQRVAYQSTAGGNFDIYGIAADGSGTPVHLTFGLANDVDPAFSPDGLRLAFSSDRTGNAELFVKTLGGGLLQLTHVPGSAETQPT